MPARRLHADRAAEYAHRNSVTEVAGDFSLNQAYQGLVMPRWLAGPSLVSNVEAVHASVYGVAAREFV